MSNLTVSVGIIEEVQETCDVEFLGSAMPLYAMFVGQLVSKLVPEKDNATSTEARLATGGCTMQYKQLYMCRLYFLLCCDYPFLLIPSIFLKKGPLHPVLHHSVSIS